MNSIQQFQQLANIEYLTLIFGLMRYTDFIRDPDWPPQEAENSLFFVNSLSEPEPLPDPQPFPDPLLFSHLDPTSYPHSLYYQSPSPRQASPDEIFYSDSEGQEPRQSSVEQKEIDDLWKDLASHLDKKTTTEKKQAKKAKDVVERGFERGRYKILSEEEKKNIVQESQKSTIVDVAKKYGVSVNNICRWRKRCNRRSGAGRKVTDTEMEGQLLDWIESQSGVICRREVQEKAKELAKQSDFKASKGWFERFYKRNKLYELGSIQILTSSHYRRRAKGGQQLAKGRDRS